MYVYCFVADIFEVEIIESPASKKNKLVGAYNLRVNTLNMTLCEPSSGRSILIWPYRYIRRLVIFTARVRSTTGAYVFTGVCLLTWGDTPVPGSFLCLWSQVLSRGVPQSQVLSQVIGPRSFQGGTCPRSLVPCPFQGYPSPGWGYPSTGWGGGVFPLTWMDGTIQPGQDWGIPLTRSGWGTPLARSEWGTPDNSRVSTCYGVGGKPHAFMQEDFLVQHCFY